MLICRWMVCSAMTKILKESLIYGNHEDSPKQRSTSVAFKSRVGHHLSYANAVQGRVVDSRSPVLKGGGVGSVVLGMSIQQFWVRRRSLIWAVTTSKMSLNDCHLGMEWVPWGIRGFLVLPKGRMAKLSRCLIHMPVSINSKC